MGYNIMKSLCFLIVLFLPWLSFAKINTDSSCEFGLFYSPVLCYEKLKNSNIDLDVKVNNTRLYFTHRPSLEEAIDDNSDLNVQIGNGVRHSIFDSLFEGTVEETVETVLQFIRDDCPEPADDPLDYPHWSDYYGKAHTVFSVAYGLISTPFDCYHNKERYAKLRELMREVDPMAVDPDGETPVHVAAQYGLVKEIGSLKSRGANLNARNKYDHTPIGTAIVTFNYNTTKALLENGACLDTEPVYSWQGEEESPLDVLVWRTNRVTDHERQEIQDAIFELVESHTWPVCPGVKNKVI